METKTKVQSSTKVINKGVTLEKIAAKVKAKEVSKYRLLLDANREIKNEMYSLSAAIRFVKELPKDNKFIQATKTDVNLLTPANVLTNIVKVPNFKNIKGEIYFTCTIKGTKTDILKVKWSPFNVLQSIYYS